MSRCYGDNSKRGRWLWGISQAGELFLDLLQHTSTFQSTSSASVGAFINDPALLAAAGQDELLNSADLVIWARAQLFVNVHPAG